MMFEDFRTFPPLLALLWTAVMFWISLAWTIYALVANSNLKTAEALAADLGDFDELPADRRYKIKKLCRNRLWRPFFIWLKGLIMILIFGIFVFASY